MRNIRSKLATIIPVALLALLSALNSQLSTLFAQGTAFTYQGRLSTNGSPATGNYDFTFALFSASSGAGQVGATLTSSGVTVNNGLFTVPLDFGANFSGADRWLEISVRTSGSGAFTSLSSRQKLTPSPYAIFSGNAAQLGGQSAGAYVAKAGDTMTGRLDLPADGLMVGVAQFAVSSGNVGVGIGSPTGAHLQVFQTGQGVGLFVGDRTPFGQAMFETDLTGPATHAWFAENGINVFNVASGGNGFFKGSLSINGSVLFGDGSGNLGVEGDITANGSVIGNSTATDGSGSGVHGYGYRVGTVGTASRGVIGESANNTGVYGQSQTATGVEGASTSGWGVHGHSQNNTGVYGRTDIAGPTLAGVFGDNGADGGTGVVGRGLANNSAGVAGVADGVNTTGVYGRGTAWAGYFDGGVRVSCLTIAGGCDIAEPFEMSNADIPKGAVVVIDDENAGQLKISDRTYDHRVAGIVSGANGINPGVTLHQDGALEGGQNVALSGRVYVLADASSGPIKPGDLLTTSSTPGHAMKITDHAKAQGAILGKAMSSLKQGKGMVLVLVTLQ